MLRIVTDVIREEAREAVRRKLVEYSPVHPLHDTIRFQMFETLYNLKCYTPR